MAEEEIREENVADIDFSQIRTSIQLGGRMIEQILNSIHYGSPEVRCLILDECDVILECRVCRGLFRALPNFIAHKRVYCKQAYIITQQNIFDTLPEEDVVVVQPAAPDDIFNPQSDKTFHSDKAINKSADEKIKDTIFQITNGTLGKSEMYKLYSQAADKIHQQKKSKKTLDVVLTKIASNPNAVQVSYQKHTEKDIEPSCMPSAVDQQVSSNPDRKSKNGSENFISSFVSKNKQDKLDQKSKLAHQSEFRDNCFVSKEDVPQSQETVNSYKTQEHSVHSELCLASKMCVKKKENEEFEGKSNVSTCSRNALTSDNMKVREKDKLGISCAENIFDISLLKCLQCNTKYSSRKTLLYHVQMRHSGLRTFFPCPYCSNVFFYFWGLTRHLRVNHKKTHNQINKMRRKLRDTAFSKTVTKPCIQAKNQLEFTTEMNASAHEISSDKLSEIDTRTRSPKRKCGIDMTEPLLVEKTVKQNKICSKATVKHTPKHVKHIFARRNVPTAERVNNELLDRSQEAKSRVENVQQYSHRLSCDICRKVFWKKQRLANHRKFCTQRINASNLKTPSQSIKLCSCETPFLGNSPFKRHEQICPQRIRMERKNVFINNGKLVDVNEDASLEQSFKFSCTICKRTFGRNISLENHRQSCLINANKRTDQKKAMADTIQSTESKESKHCQLGKRKKIPVAFRGKDLELNSEINTDCLHVTERPPEKDEVHVVEEIWINKQPGRPSEKVKSKRIYVMEAESAGRLLGQDTKKLYAFMDEPLLKCTRCGQEFTSVSNLRRHAIRHLGWKRFKCKLCCYSSYIKSECDTHIVRTHSEKYQFTSVENLYIDLNEGLSRICSHEQIQTLSADQSAKMTISDNVLSVEKRKNRKRAEKDGKEVESEKLKNIDPTRKFNISTRNSPRKFDTRPYQKIDSLSTLFTRKGYYPKPKLECGIHIDGSYTDSVEEIKKSNTTKVQLAKSLQEGRSFVQQCHSLLVKDEGTDRHFLDKQIENKDTQLLTTFSPSKNNLPHNISTNNLTEERSQHGVKSDDNEQKKEMSKGKKRHKSDCRGAPLKLLRSEKSVDNSMTQLQMKQQTASDTKSSDNLAPWPRASEPMSVREMFDLIRRSPRAGCGIARRRSIGSTTAENMSELCPVVSRKPGVRRSVEVSARTSPRTEGKTNLRATLARRSPAGNTLSLSLRTSRPGVDWSQSAGQRTRIINENIRR